MMMTARNIVKKLVLPTVICTSLFVLSLPFSQPPTSVTPPPPMPSSPSPSEHSESHGKVFPKIPVRTGLSDEEYQELKRIHGERSQLLNSKCKNLPKISDFKYRLLLGQVSKRSELLEKYHTTFCVVHKAGSTAWHTMVAHLYNQTKLIEKKSTYKMLDVLKPQPAKFMEAVESPKYLRFLVVRDPLSRILSAYRDRIVDISHPSWQAHHFVPEILKLTRGRKYTNEELYFSNRSVRITPTFEEFVRFISDGNPKNFDPHWRPIYLQCGICYINYTNIVHTETYIQDMRFIMKESGMDEAVDASLLTLDSHHSRGGSSDDLLESYYSTLDPSLVQKLINVYRNDFIYFGYDPSELIQKIYRKFKS